MQTAQTNPVAANEEPCQFVEVRSIKVGEYFKRTATAKRAKCLIVKPPTI
jgi:hypothetical protein